MKELKHSQWVRAGLRLHNDSYSSEDFKDHANTLMNRAAQKAHEVGRLMVDKSKAAAHQAKGEVSAKFKEWKHNSDMLVNMSSKEASDFTNLSRKLTVRAVSVEKEISRGEDYTLDINTSKLSGLGGESDVSEIEKDIRKSRIAFEVAAQSGSRFLDAYVKACKNIDVDNEEALYKSFFEPIHKQRRDAFGLIAERFDPKNEGFLGGMRLSFKGDEKPDAAKIAGASNVSGVLEMTKGRSYKYNRVDDHEEDKRTIQVDQSTAIAYARCATQYLTMLQTYEKYVKSLTSQCQKGMFECLKALSESNDIENRSAQTVIYVGEMVQKNFDRVTLPLYRHMQKKALQLITVCENWVHQREYRK